MHRWRWLAVLIGVLVHLPGRLAAQIPGNEQEEYHRLLELTGQVTGSPLLYRSMSSNEAASVTADSVPWPKPIAPPGRRLFPLGLTGMGTFNSRYASGINDGALWSGRGFSGSIAGGFRYTVGPFSATLYPTLWAAQNRSFDIVTVTTPPYSPWSNPWHVGGIDWPQRFGSKALARLDAGQSDVRLQTHGVTLGLSSENLTWGPAFRNPIVMSNSAAGFPHVDLGTSGPIRTPLGMLEARLVWGRLAESSFFDTLSTNDARLFTGLTVGLQPRWLPGMTLGVTRVLYATWDSTTRAADFVEVFQPFFKDNFRTTSNPEGDDRRDQVLSLIGRWVLPEGGFEAYVEWARNDHNINLRDFLSEPDHSQAWTLGFQKSLGHGARRQRLRGEWTHLGRSETFQVRPTPTYYVHHIVTQGYTHEGQLLGAGIGPGSNSQHVGFDTYSPSGRWGGYIERVGYDNDAYYARFGPTRYYEGHNVEVTLGASAYRRVTDRLATSLLVRLTRELNRHYVVKNDVTNLHMTLHATWHP